MDKQTRKVKMSALLLQQMFTQGNVMHFCVTKGFPPDVEIVSMEADFTSPTNPFVMLEVKGNFSEGDNGEIFDIVAKTIHNP